MPQTFSRCSFADFWHWILWWGRRKGFLLMTLPWRSYLCRCRCTVEQCTTTPESAKSSWRSFAVKWGFWFAFLAILRAVLLESFLGLPDLNLTSTVLIRTEQTSTWKMLCYRFTTFSCFEDINDFNFQSARQLLRGAHGCWLLGQGLRSQSIYKALKFASPGLS